MANKLGKSVDTTYLRLANNTNIRGYIHRDYLAHCLRYSHVARYMFQKNRHKTAHLLDVGCGKETPLARLLFSMMLTHTTGSYTGVDYGKIDYPETIPTTTKKFKLKLIQKTDFVDAKLPRKLFDVVVSFEVLEHVEPLHAFRMLQRMREVVTRNGRVLISTPCYDAHVGAAANHVNEMSMHGLHMLIRLAGLQIENVWGTFASQRDYKHLIDHVYPGGQKIYDELVRYYDSNVVACLFAPLFPEHARNCLWRLKRGRVIDKVKVKQLARTDHSSSKLWPRHVRKIVKEVCDV